MSLSIKHFIGHCEISFALRAASSANVYNNAFHSRWEIYQSCCTLHYAIITTVYLFICRQMALLWATARTEVSTTTFVFDCIVKHETSQLAFYCLRNRGSEHVLMGVSKDSDTRLHHIVCHWIILPLNWETMDGVWIRNQIYWTLKQIVTTYNFDSLIELHNESTKKKTPWPESASELYRPSDRCLSAKWLPTFAAHINSSQSSLDVVW
jgi:hypothetical protein